MLVEEFSGSSAGHGLGVVTAMALVAATVRVQSLALEVLEALGVAKKIKINASRALRHGGNQKCLPIVPIPSTENHQT